MTDSSGPRHDEPQDPATQPLPAASGNETYPPGFDPRDPDVSAGPEAVAVGQAGVEVPAEARKSRRPVLAGVAGGVLIALLGFGGGFAVGHASGDDDGSDQSQYAQQDGRPPLGEGGPGGRIDRDGDGDTAHGIPGAPGTDAPAAPGTDDDGADT